MGPGGVEQSVGSPLGDAREIGDRDRQEVQDVATGAPWKLPLDSTGPSSGTTGLSMAQASSQSAIVRACCRVSRAVPSTAGVHRNE